MAINAEVIIFLLLVFVTTRKYRSNTYLRYLPYLVIFLFMAIRYNYGDGISYVKIFDYLHNGMSVPGMNLEPLYCLLNRLLPSFQMVIVVTSLIYVIAIYILISKTLTFEQRSLALMIVVLHPYILMVDMSAIRQSVAIAFVVLGVYFANRYRVLYYIPFCLIAALFHKSAIILLPIVFLLKKRAFTKKTKVIIMGISCAFLLVPEWLFKIINSAIELVKLNNSNYLSYLNNGYENSIQAVILSLIVLVFFLVCGDTVESDNSIYVKLSIIAIVAELLQGRVQALGRIQMYFMPFIAISIPLILKNGQTDLMINLPPKSVLVKNGYILVEVLLLFVFLWKFMRFMTPQYAYYTILTAQ